jgi:DNA-binding LacI/PurR family transcriptional regulator
VWRRGLTPGVEVGVTGFDDSPLASVVPPGLTSVRQPIDEIATELLGLLTDPRAASAPSSTERLLQPHLVIRGSSAPG